MTWILSGFADEAGSTTQQQIDATRNAGFKHLDLRSIEGHNISELPVDIAKEVKEKLDKAGIAVGMFGSPLGKIDLADDFAIDRRKLDHLGTMRDVFDCNAVRIFSYYNKEGKLTTDQWQARAIDRLHKLKDQARNLGLVLYHENESHIFGDRIDQVEVIAREVRDGEVFKLIFDFDNYNRSGDNVYENWQRLKHATDAFHLKDSDAKGQHVPIGQGAGQAKKILTEAVAMGWSGPVSLEPHLRHSSAVQATNVHGSENQSFKQKTEPECYQIAADAALDLMREIGASFE